MWAVPVTFSGAGSVSPELPGDSALLEAIPAAACVVQSEELIVRGYNQRFLSLVNRTDPLGDGMRLRDLLPAEPRDAVTLALRYGQAVVRSEAARGGPTYQVHVSLVGAGADGSRWQMITFWEITDRPGLPDVEGSMRVANERLTISALEARAAAERETRERDEAQQRAAETDAVLAAISDVLLVYDMHGRVLRANPAAREVLGSDPVGMTWTEVAQRVHLQRMDGQPIDRLPAMRALAGDGSSAEALLITSADGLERVVNPSAAPLELAPGETGVVSVWRDVTERERLIQQLKDSSEALKQADQHKDDFLATLSHELRNPLAPIRNSLYVLEHAVPGGEQAGRAQAVIHRQVDHLTRLVDELLDLNRITRGKVQLQPERLSLGELVLRTAEDHKPGFAGRGIGFQVNVTAEPLWVDADPIRVVQVIGNLLHNAAKFTPPGGRVELRLELEAGQAMLAVRDTGSGIEPELLGRLFKPFMQADRTLDRSGGGLGLGLALVKGLVELHGGSVSVASEGPGRGAEFTVRLPLVAPPAPAVAKAAEPKPAQRLRVLVVEDSLDTAESLLEVVGLMGHDGDMAGNGQDALAVARRHPPDVVLCDIGLPGMDGYEVAQAFRADPGLRSCHLVALSGYAQPEDRARAAEAGFAAHLCKPPNLSALEKLLSEIRPPRRS